MTVRNYNFQRKKNSEKIEPDLANDERTFIFARRPLAAPLIISRHMAVALPYYSVILYCLILLDIVI